MKKIVEYKRGDLIPSNAKYLKTENDIDLYEIEVQMEKYINQTSLEEVLFQAISFLKVNPKTYVNDDQLSAEKDHFIETIESNIPKFKKMKPTYNTIGKLSGRIN